LDRFIRQRYCKKLLTKKRFPSLFLFFYVGDFLLVA
jgi:hypothetical protein